MFIASRPSLLFSWLKSDSYSTMVLNLSRKYTSGAFNSITSMPCCHRAGEYPVVIGIRDIWNWAQPSFLCIAPALKCPMWSSPLAVCSLTFLHPRRYWASVVLACFREVGSLICMRLSHALVTSDVPGGGSYVPLRTSGIRGPSPIAPRSSYSCPCSRGHRDSVWWNLFSFSTSIAASISFFLVTSLNPWFCLIWIFVVPLCFFFVA